MFCFCKYGSMINKQTNKQTNKRRNGQTEHYLEVYTYRLGTSTPLNIHTCTLTRTHACTLSVCVSLFLSFCVCVYMYIYIYVCVCVCVCVLGYIVRGNRHRASTYLNILRNLPPCVCVCVCVCVCYTNNLAEFSSLVSALITIDAYGKYPTIPGISRIRTQTLQLCNGMF